MGNRKYGDSVLGRSTLVELGKKIICGGWTGRGSDFDSHLPLLSDQSKSFLSIWRDSPIRFSIRGKIESKELLAKL